MTEGLTFDESSVSVKYKQTNGVEQEKTLNKDINGYNLEKLNNKENGFKLSLTDKALETIKATKQDVTVTITYKAVLNSKTQVDISELNSVSFHYE